MQGRRDGPGAWREQGARLEIKARVHTSQRQTERDKAEDKICE